MERMLVMEAGIGHHARHPNLVVTYKYELRRNGTVPAKTPSNSGILPHLPPDRANSTSCVSETKGRSSIDDTRKESQLGTCG